MSMVSPTLGFLGTVVESTRQNLARLARHRVRWVVAGGLVLLGCGCWLLGANAADEVDGPLLQGVLLWWLLGSVLMPWLTIYLGVHAAHGDLEDRTAQYLFLRPVGRAPLLLGKWLAAALAGAAVGVLGVLVVDLALAAHDDLWFAGREHGTAVVFAMAMAVGAAAYAAAAVLFSAAFRRPLLMAAVFVVGLQQLAANLPVSPTLRQVTIADPMRRIIVDGIRPDPHLANELWPAQRFGADFVGEPWLDLAWFTGVCLALACWIYSRTEYESRHRE
jgi:hypothetical protein